MSIKRILPGVLVLALASGVSQAQIHKVPDQVRRDALAAEAHIERMVMVPMRDGVELASRVYIPKDGEGPFPAILWRSPYDFSEKKIPNPDYSDANLKFALDAVRHGYVFIMQNERGKFFSDGDWEILGRPRTDGHDTMDWIEKQPWSNGRVGTIGCSSTAEWIMGLASKPHRAHRAAVPMAQGAGIGRMGPHYEMGNFYRGGAIQLPMVSWLYGNQNLVRPTFPEGLTREERIRVSRFYDLKPDMPAVDWSTALAHLPSGDIITAAGGPPGFYDEMVERTPDDPAWYQGGLYHDNEDFTVPALWVNSWYDLSVAPNAALFNHVRENASKRYVRDNQYMIIGPTEHCHMYRLREPHVVGERDMGIVDIDLDSIVYGFFDQYLKGNDSGFDERQPEVMYFAMGANEWRESSTWPPEGSTTRTLYLSSAEGANSLQGDGSLTAAAPSREGMDSFVYDPLNPVQSIGGNTCCLADALPPGSFDQRPVESRADVLVYSSEPLAEPLEVSGPVFVTLYVSSDAKDTDFTVKLVDIDTDGAAWNLDESIKRVRYRNGYQRPELMQAGEVYELELGPLITSNVFEAGHRIGIEVSSSSFPRFERNLNTGGLNARETETVSAVNAVHFGPSQASRIVLTVSK